MLIIYSFGFGFIAGIAISILVVVILTYFRQVIEPKIEIIGKQIKNAGPRPKGFIINPLSDADEARANIIARNKVQGRSTKISELQ